MGIIYTALKLNISTAINTVHQITRRIFENQQIEQSTSFKLLQTLINHLNPCSITPVHTNILMTVTGSYYAVKQISDAETV